ncbi:cytochrome d ubiquinol oxidase subunit II [Desulfuromonas sp. TF]|uniref:cytochrome d ubiquinol oxidase subunit II n=1 Tax=Desulfuromonas sp. TF TaxID=1232410 RepID=UPI0004145296|nr:cytochrome d ubiquinol oxidase subunit II [Desulfuromonas sp. TF]
MELENLAAAALLLGLIMYAAFGGADFGGGIWTALASGPRKKEQRERLFHAIGPVWETNHVWLIYVIVVLFMVFPTAFSVLFTALLIPLIVALIGINFRGAAFAFRHFGRQTGREVPLIARTFEISSILTPFALGMAVTATAGGNIQFDDGRIVSGLWDWISPFTLGGGVIGLAICAYLTPIYMTVRTKGELREDFRKRGMIAGFVLGGLTALQVPVAIFDAPLFAAKLLLTRTLVCVLFAAACGTATMVFLWTRRFTAAQIAAGATVALTLTGFASALYPDLLLDRMSIAEAAAPRETLIAFFTVLPFGVLILVPSLFYLYWTFRGSPDPEAPPEDFKV